jgi:hypothetical protein
MSEPKEIELLAVELLEKDPESAASTLKMLESASGLLLTVMSAMPRVEPSGAVNPQGALIHATITEAHSPISRAIHALSQENDHG